MDVSEAREGDGCFFFMFVSSSLPLCGAFVFRRDLFDGGLRLSSTSQMRRCFPSRSLVFRFLPCISPSPRVWPPGHVQCKHGGVFLVFMPGDRNGGLWLIPGGGWVGFSRKPTTHMACQRRAST